MFDLTFLFISCSSSEDLSPSYVDRATFYDRTARVSSAGAETGEQQYIRRPNNYGGGGSTIVNNGGTSSLNSVIGGVAGGVVIASSGVVNSIVSGSGVATTADGRGRTRDRPYRNGPYSSSVIDR